MFTAIRNWVVQTMMKGQTGVVRTLPKNDLIELNTQITAERMLRNGINPNDMKTVGQVDNVVKQIDTPKVNVNPGITSIKKADVMDMEGNKIPEGSKIMGGKAVPETSDRERVRNEMKNKYGFTDERLDEIENTQFNEKLGDDLLREDDERIIKERLEKQNKDSVQRLKDKMDDPEEFADGGRIGLKGGTLLNFLKNIGKTMNEKSPAKVYTDYLKSVKKRAQEGDMKTLAPEMGIIAGGGILTNRFLKKKLEKMNEAAKAEVEEKADGGRIGLLAGSVPKISAAISAVLKNKKKVQQAVDNIFPTGDYKYDAEMAADALVELNPKDFNNLLREDLSDEISSEIYGAVLKPIMSNMAEMRELRKATRPEKTLQSMKEGKGIDISDPEIADEFTTFMKETDPKGYKELEQKVELSNFKTKGRKENSDGGRIGLFMGGGNTAGKSVLRQILNYFGKKSDSVKNPSDILRIVNPKRLNELLENPEIYRKFDIEKGIAAPDLIKNLQKQMNVDRKKTIQEMLSSAKNIKSADDNTIKYKNKMIEDMIKKGVDRNMAEEMAGTISKMAENAAGKTNTPKLTDEGILQLENILKNMETGGKKARDLNADGGRIGLEGGTNEDFQNYLKERERFEKKRSLEQLFKEYKEDLRRKGVMEQKQMAADGGRIGLKAGMTKRNFLKLMGSVGAGIGAVKSGIFSGLGKGAGKTVAKEVAKQTTSSMPPPYFFKLAEKIKFMGDDAVASQDKAIAKTYKDYVLEEDFAGNIEIKKTNYGMFGDEVAPTEEVYMSYRVDDVPVKGKKGSTKVEEYEEYTVRPDEDGKMKDVEDGVPDDVIDDAGDPDSMTLKKASGGIARMLGE